MRSGLDARHCVGGGFAQLTSITKESIGQKVFHRWAEDRVDRDAATDRLKVVSGPRELNRQRMSISRAFAREAPNA